ncbi:protein kinase domain-containing protein [Microcoleus sp. D2_18a_D3]|uniref:protein kinase domain-containing protein n=1 Tax=Microcoleus sp. D2_18a_D3 TaxID=3055330 RepID=UPI002FCEBFB5
MASINFTSINFRLTGYQTLAPLYSGTRTLVYRAFRIDDKQPVAIKVLRNEYPSFRELVHFRNQYTIAKNLNLPGIIETYSLEPYQNSYALVMEDFGGISLKEWTEKGETRPSLSDFLQVAIDLSNTLDILYRHRIIHKDIKPANILINPHTKQVKLIDFSIASLLPRETQTLMNPNVLEGTLGYLSPEQTGRMNRGIDYRTDFYSLGVSFYELLAGKLPFQSNDAMELVHCHIAKQPPSLHEINPEIPPVLSEIVSKLMAKNAEDRYQSALGLKFDLEFCLKQLEENGRIQSFTLAQKDVCDRFLIPEKLYGRETEVKRLLESFERVAHPPENRVAKPPQSHASSCNAEDRGNGLVPQSSGGIIEGEMMLVAGFSGLGKTAVINEVHKPITRQKGYFIKGKFDQFNRNIPFSAFVQALRDLMGQLFSESDRQLAQWRTRILEAIGGNGQVLIEVIPELEIIIGKQPPAPELSGTAAQNRFNLLFQKFIALFATSSHPLVMFLDDWQWSDLASLQLIKLLMENNSYLLVLGAYRDNEVSPVHPFMLTLDELKKTGKTVNTITLAPLAFSDTNQLVADTLQCNHVAAKMLTELIYRKTQGNPFFTTQFLKALHEDGLIVFNPYRGYWECDIAQINVLSLTSDVVQFMAQQLQKLPAQTQEILKVAACIGNSFDINTLAIVSEKSQVEAADALWKALQEGLIRPQSEVYKFYLNHDDVDNTNTDNIANVGYRFLHDRVQQAAYSLIADNQKQASHLRIARLLLEASSENRESDLFQIVNQFNQCLEIVDSSEEILTIAKLNRIAATKARETTAFAAAREYASIGISLLGEDAWQANYDLMLALRNCSAEAAYLSGSFEVMNNSIADILSHARTLEDRLAAYEVKLQALKAQNQLQEAIDLGLKILNFLEISLPKNATPSDIEQAFNEMETALEGRSISELIDLPEMGDRAILAATRILASLCPVAHMAQFNLLPILLFQQVKLALRYGNAPAHTHAYAGLGLILCCLRDDIEIGYEAGKLALALLDRIEAEAFRSASTFVATYFTLPWKTAIQSTFNLMLKAYTSGVNTGDLEHAAYAVERYGQLAFFSGAVELSHLETQMDGFAEFMRKQHQDSILQIHNITHQAVLNWQGKSTDPLMLAGAVYDERSVLPQHHKQNNRLGLIYYYLHKLILVYLFADDSQAAVDCAIKTIPYLDGGSGSILLPLFHTYDSLARLRNYGDVSPEKQQQYLTEVAANQKKIKNWANYAPMNYLHKHDLVEAERYRVLLRNYEAADFYDRAIVGAKENEYIQEQALANELAAKFYLDWGKEKVAQAYMQEAYYCYARWGAKAKIDDLEKRYPQLLAPILQARENRFGISETCLQKINKSSILHQTFHTSLSSSNSIYEALDFATILKASQALSSEIQLEKLLAALMSVVMENAGATKAVLLLVKDGNLAIEAVASFHQDVISMSVPLSPSDEVPAAVLNYVKRTWKTVVLDNAAVRNDFIADLYLMLKKPKSVLCTPILNQGKLIGLLYLENNLTVAAFTDDRTEVIQLLCVQAAISIENARLYQKSQSYAQELERSLLDLQEAQLQIVQSEKMSTLGNLVTGIAHEINNPVGFISGNIEEATITIKDLINHLKLYQEKLPNPGKEIEEDAEDIDLEYALEDLPKMLLSMKVGCDRIRGISTSLRTFSRADKDYKVPFNIHEGIDSTILILKHRLKANEHHPAIEVVTDYGNLPQIECFPGQLNQVFMNLLANAIDALEESNQGRSFEALKATPHCITVRTRLLGDRHIKIQIADNGAGMTESVKQRIFDHLFTTKPVGKGTGLGLAIARQIVVETHGGTINVNSTLGGGSEFEIVLPISA